MFVCACVLQYSYERSEEADGVEFGVLSESDIGSKMVMVHNVNPVKVSGWCSFTQGEEGRGLRGLRMCHLVKDRDHCSM